jgi:hypothetical protein
MAPTWSIVDYCAGLVRLQVVWPQQSNPHTLELVSEERDRTTRVQGGCTPRWSFPRYTGLPDS